LELADGFVEHNGNGGGEVEASGSGEHRDGETAVRMGREEVFRESAGFSSEDECIAIGKGGRPVGTVGFGGEQEEAACLRVLEAVWKGIPRAFVALVPVVHPGAPTGGMVNVEAEGSDQVEARSGGGAEACDIAGIGRDFRLDEDDVKHGLGASGGGR
jgi:hypothetical protein